MKILITGGTGLIGKALSTTLVKEGHTVTVLTRSSKKAQGLTSLGITTVKWDGYSPTGWSHLIEKTDAIINLAGESIAGDSLSAILTRRWTDEQKKHIIQSRTDAGQALVTAIKSAAKKPEVFIQASAVGFYGSHGDQVISESTPGGSDFLAEVCQVWENSTLEVEKMGIRRAVIRTGLVLAPEGGILPMMLLPFRLFVGGPIGDGNQAIPWIHLEDEVNAIRFLLENKETQGEYNLSAPNPISNADFGRIAGRVLNRPYWFPVPGFALRLVLGEKATLVLDGQRAVPQRLLELGYKFEFKNVETALQNLQ